VVDGEIQLATLDDVGAAARHWAATQALRGPFDAAATLTP